MERQRAVIEEKLRNYRKMIASLDQFITAERESRRIMTNVSLEIEEKDVAPFLMAGVRMKGKYSDCGKGFSRIGRGLGRQIQGKPFLLHYDQEYREDDADFEACLPIRAGKPVEGISVREFPGGRCVSLVHRGPTTSSAGPTPGSFSTSTTRVTRSRPLPARSTSRARG